MPLGIQPIHLIVILIVALIIFGPKRLPEIGRGLGKSINEFRQGTREMTESFREEVTKPEGTGATQPPAPADGSVYCSQCGGANLLGAKFCSKCGASMPA
ncbi:MAG TPA: twin-arginine translocase TatA/TatE family subunit [Anaerolineae bacterium]